MKVESLKNSFETLKKIPVDKLSQYMSTNISDYLIVSLIELAVINTVEPEIKVDAIKLLHLIETTPTSPPES